MELQFDPAKVDKQLEMGLIDAATHAKMKGLADAKGATFDDHQKALAAEQKLNILGGVVPEPQLSVPDPAPTPTSEVQLTGVDRADYNWVRPSMGVDSAPLPDDVQLASDIQRVPLDQNNALGAYQQQIAMPFLMQQQAIAQGMAAGAAKGAEQAAYLEKVQKEEARLRQDQANAEIDRQKKLDDQLKTLNDKANELANNKVDPKRVYKNMSTGDKILAGIGLFLGAFGRTGGNTAVAAINRAVEQDIKAQQADHENEKNQYIAQSGVYSDMVTTFKDKRLAEDAARVAYLNHAQLELNRIASKYSGQEAQAKAMDLYGQLEQKKQAAQISFMQKWRELNPIQVTSTTSPAMLTKDQRERWVPGFGVANSDWDKKEFVKFYSSVSGGRYAIENLLRLNEIPLRSMNPSVRAEATTWIGNAVGEFRLLIMGPGPLTNDERKMLIDMIGNPTNMLTLQSSTKVKLKTILKKIDHSVKEKARLHGLSTPADRLGIKKVGP